MTSGNFRSYNQAVELYKSAKVISLPHGLRDQLMRAAASVVLNLQEGSAKPSPKERRRFYTIAYASLKEVQAIIELEEQSCQPIISKADVLGAMLYGLSRGP